MGPALFMPAPIGLRGRLLDIRIEDRISYSATTNTLFLNYAGMHVRTADDVGRIKHAVDAALAPVGHRVNAIVNYDKFVADPAVIDAYADLVQYVEERYYLRVSRYSTSGFLRLKLGAELHRRRLSGHVFETRREARRHLED
jgi:propionate CoA-transferase